MQFSKFVKEILKEAQDLEEGWERITIILKTEDFKKLKSISDIKGLFIKDIVNDLIKIYNEVAITDKDNENIKEEKSKLVDEIKKLVQIQSHTLSKIPGNKQKRKHNGNYSKRFTDMGER